MDAGGPPESMFLFQAGQDTRSTTTILLGSCKVLSWLFHLPFSCWTINVAPERRAKPE